MPSINTEQKLMETMPNYVVTKDEDGDPWEELELQISSQDETGIKLTKGFDIEEGAVTELILDWDMEKSIMKNILT